MSDSDDLPEAHRCSVLITLITRSAPAVCPTDFGNDCRLDHLEFPSQMNAMCRGSWVVTED